MHTFWILVSPSPSLEMTPTKASGEEVSVGGHADVMHLVPLPWQTGTATPASPKLRQSVASLGTNVELAL